MEQRDHIATRLATAASAASVILTAAAFWLSYQHLHDVDTAHGLAHSEARAWAWPATVDLFIIIGELLILRSSLAGRVDKWAVSLAVVGSGGSIALNVAGVGTQAPLLDQIVAAVPPVAALLAFGALMRQIHEHITTQRDTTAQPETRAETPDPPTETAEIEAQPAETPDRVKLLSTREVALRMGVSPSTVGTWVSRGKLTPTGRDERGNLFDPTHLAG